MFVLHLVPENSGSQSFEDAGILDGSRGAAGIATLPRLPISGEKYVPDYALCLPGALVGQAVPDVWLGAPRGPTISSELPTTRQESGQSHGNKRPMPVDIVSQLPKPDF
jgi:hypothetical protein